MTDTPDPTSPAPAGGDAPRKRGGGLNSMLLADLKALAAGMGVAGAGGMRKAQLVDAIRSAQSAGAAGPAADAPAQTPPRATRSRRTAGAGE
ncbi:Rho termination factor N-terminal domain-containing protein, partial [Nocardioides sp. Leaf374]|uniref:Rho termination factor N-terminal domain-containing protein n=1 Tax=Nocardioides sp. Leaf374 TaxID=2876560 RepID=UPI001E3FC19D